MPANSQTIDDSRETMTNIIVKNILPNCHIIYELDYKKINRLYK